MVTVHPRGWKTSGAAAANLETTGEAEQVYASRFAQVEEKLLQVEALDYEAPVEIMALA